ncbi:MAG: LptF/LptG family permease [Flavobacteriaceae bacterium]|nr:LptF/LptG family permease [Flavobacteriaceae bacterium]
MKILDKYILKSYLTKLLSVFIILMFIFIIQTFWLFIDEFAGKGLDMSIIIKFLIYYSPKLIPLVLPLSVLLSSIMTYGEFAENYEFAAMKATGISLKRAMVALLFLHFFLGIGTYYFANYIIPYGELKYFNLRKNLAKLKPALAITEGIFNDIGQMNLKVEKKYGDGNRFLKDVIIHEKTPDFKNRIVIKSESGELKSATIDQQMQLILFNGHRYEEIKPNGKEFYPHSKVFFKKYIMNIDLSQFNNVNLDEELYTSTYKMQNVNELNSSIDSLQTEFIEEKNIYSANFSKTNNFNQNIPTTYSSVGSFDSIEKFNFTNPLEFSEKGEHHLGKQDQIISAARTTIGNTLKNLEINKRKFFIYQKLINLHKNSLNEKYTLGFGVFILFIIGASLGAIIRKGGLGLPMVLAVLIFLTYHYIGLFGRNASEDNTLSPLIGSWLSTFIITPFAYYLIKRASSDRSIFTFEFGLIQINRIFNTLKMIKKKN